MRERKEAMRDLKKIVLRFAQSFFDDGFNWEDVLEVEAQMIRNDAKFYEGEGEYEIAETLKRMAELVKTASNIG